MFLPMTMQEAHARGWDALDVVLVTGDAYIDSPLVGVAVIGKILVEAGYRVGVVAQPGTDSERDIGALGEPRLFWGVTGGCTDSLVANRTATGRPRKQDDYTPGGINNRRPDRAVIVYSNLIRRFFKATRPIVLGGIEASLRRLAHYDFWSDRIRRSVLIDAKADYLLYGMADRSVVELADRLRANADTRDVRGLCYTDREPPPDDCLELPTFEETAADKHAFTAMFNTFYANSDPLTGRRLAQKHGLRYVVQNPPAPPLTPEQLDAVHDLNYELEAHPACTAHGAVRALETIRFSIATHRGCYGECSFCAIAVHQGRIVQSRGEASVLEEARRMTRHPRFKGIIQDVGGPTANMYGFECAKKTREGCCTNRRCMFPSVCGRLGADHARQLALLTALRKLPGVRRVFVASGLRHDLVLADAQHGRRYLEQLVRHHVSGQLKLAPEHSQPDVLRAMGKPGTDALLRFKAFFEQLNRAAGMNQFLTYYMIAAHPGCTLDDMYALKRFATDHLGLLPEQTQIFTPTPSTYASLMYWTEKDPFTGQPIFVEKRTAARERQKQVIAAKVSARARGSRGG